MILNEQNQMAHLWGIRVTSDLKFRVTKITVSLRDLHKENAHKKGSEISSRPHFLEYSDGVMKGFFLTAKATFHDHHFKNPTVAPILANTPNPAGDGIFDSPFKDPVTRRKTRFLAAKKSY